MYRFCAIFLISFEIYHRLVLEMLASYKEKLAMIEIEYLIL